MEPKPQSTIPVFCRIRPLSVRETANLRPIFADTVTSPQPQYYTTSVYPTSPTELLIHTPTDPNDKNKVRPTSCAFTQVFPQAASQSEVFEAVARPLLERIVSPHSGEKGCLFVLYGEIHSGKRWTAMGPKFTGNLAGIVPRILGWAAEKKICVRFSAIEMYNGTLIDLLEKDWEKLIRKELKVREERATGEICVEGLTEESITSLEEGETLHRMDTNMKRYETFFNINIPYKTYVYTIKLLLPDKQVKTVRIVKLKGIEVEHRDIRVSRRMNIDINTLERVISALVDLTSPAKKFVHVPFRDSKLTRILTRDFDGKTALAFILTMSPSYPSADVSLQSWMFATRARQLNFSAMQPRIVAPPVQQDKEAKRDEVKAAALLPETKKLDKSIA